MYDAAVHLYKRLSRGEDVPVFAMLLFARDSCDSPPGLLTNHLNKTGDTGGLEQVSRLLPPSPPSLFSLTQWCILQCKCIPEGNTVFK